ncbi:MAG: hypothetical protein CL583_05415 [Alteromonadaceae bacterium]|uniref:Type II secretion system protein GspB C-terminal domain-containing protein n=2 Tax=Hydrocarboniclastica marina TaxID=2259620 RepID=A0A4P7XLY4_9ALTE|nr:hypothetical protein [Alteromonadaceae bacterium]QCF27893.1 hypothetical protein soil367_10010 [Hydrocarboniclastica marina]
MNGLLLAWLFWPQMGSQPLPAAVVAPPAPVALVPAPGQWADSEQSGAKNPEPYLLQETPRPASQANTRPSPGNPDAADARQPETQQPQAGGTAVPTAVLGPQPEMASAMADSAALPAPGSNDVAQSNTPAQAVQQPGPEQATWGKPDADVAAAGEEVPSDQQAGFAVPALGEMSTSFQRRVPDLVFNSHIFSSRPDARRVMINSEYLREGARFGDMIVEEITEDGVILSLQGELFAVSVVRNWNRPR